MGVVPRRITPRAAITKCPCHDCETRHLLCHSDCVAYKKWSVYVNTEREKYDEKYRDERNTEKYQIEQKEKMIKRKRLIKK